MTSSPIRVEVVTPVHNRREITLRCLRSIAKLEADGLRLHTIVVDDGSTDGTAAAIERDFPDVEIIRGDGDLWYTEGVNVGVRAALEHAPDYVLLINDDQVFHRSAIRTLVATAERYPGSAVGALLLLWDTPHRVFQVAPVWDTLRGGWRHWYRQTVWTVPERPWRVDLIVGNCMLVPAQAMREEGLMNSARYPMFGDAEYTPRLRKRGWQLLIEPRARVFCQPNDPRPRLREMSFADLLDATVFDLRNPHNLRRRLFASWDGAPNRLLGVAGFLIFMARLLLGRNAERSDAEAEAEPPLSQTFADAVVDEPGPQPR